MINQPNRSAFAQPSRSLRAPPWAGLVEYLPDALAAMIVVFMSMRLFGVGPLTALIWMACAGLLLISRPVAAGVALLRWWPLLITPIFAFLSFMWSDLPEVSARYGFQLLLTAFLGIFISRVLPPSRFAVAMFIGMLIFCVLSILSRREGVSEDGMVLVGLTGSKNAMAFAGNILLASSLAVLFLPGLKIGMRTLGVIGLAVALYVAAVTASATAVVMSFATIIVFVLMCMLERLPVSARTGLLLIVILLGATALILQNEINDLWLAFLRDVLHKDPSLTGRTYLWARADDLIARRPFFGHGYQSIWMGETSDTLGLLRWAGITEGRGFNFHNTYRQIAVDTGLVGMGTFIVTSCLVIGIGIRTFIVAPSVASSFVLAFFALTLTKSFTELIIGPFTAQTMLFYACGAYVIASANGARTAQANPTAGGFKRHPRVAGTGALRPNTPSR
jgi:exopolysaccharide production protein ExoQ